MTCSCAGGLTTATLPVVARSLIVIIPTRFHWQGGRKRILDGMLAKALPCGRRYQQQHDARECMSLAEIAAAERLSPSYVSRIARLALLAPDIVEAILDGRQAAVVKLNLLVQPLPVKWDERLNVLFQLWLPRAAGAIEEYGVTGIDT